MQKLGKFIRVALCAVSVALLSASGAYADRMLAGAQACTKHFPKAERYHNIPTHWLAAIASTESGRYHKRLGLMLPWPWTINVNGKGYYFDTKGEAINKIEEYRAKGVTNIDVGCMQVNMRFHGHAFANIHQALEPRYNVAYAARFLRENFDDLRSWKKATAAYHSRTPSRGKKYFQTVFRKWEKVVDKLGAATDSESLWAERPKSRQALQKYSRFTVNKDKPKYKAPKMKTIKVASALSAEPKRIKEKSEYTKSRENGVLVTRPPRKPAQPKYVYEKKIDAPLQPISIETTYEQQSTNRVATPSRFVF